MVAAGKRLAPLASQEPHVPRQACLQSGGAGEEMHSPTPVAQFSDLLAYIKAVSNRIAKTSDPILTSAYVEQGLAGSQCLWLCSCHRLALQRRISTVSIYQR